MTRYIGVTAALCAGLLSLPAAARAQMLAEAGPSRAYVGIAGTISQPVGQFDDYVGVGGGVGIHFLYQLDDRGMIGLRVDGGFISYGRESRDVCLESVGCRVTVRLSTDNYIVSGGIGPELRLPGRLVEPYANAAIGLSYFATTSSVRGTSSSDAFASTTNFDDATFAWFAGGGLYIPVSRGKHRIAIDLGARYNGNGEVEYLRKGDITDNPDGTITLHPTRSDANLVAYTIGITVGIRHD